MNELVKKARDFATNAHQRIDQRRKYTNQPYETHLKAVATLVHDATKDDTLVAAAWLHDTVEDTPATHHDIEHEFGKEVSQLVYELTDISKPSDGNRAVRKQIDREHLAKASPGGKSIKLADIIDNTRDVCRHDPNFARVYIAEAQLLLEVLQEGESYLYQKAQQEIVFHANKLGMDQAPGSLQFQNEIPQIEELEFSQRRAMRLFTEAFTAKDIAEPLRSFDSERAAADVRKAMECHGLDVVGVRQEGVVVGYARRIDLDSGLLGLRARSFSSDQLVAGVASLPDVSLVLSRHDSCFVTVLDGVAGVISRYDFEKPIVRMWLFGMITILEIDMVDRIRETWPDDNWQHLCTTGRLKKAIALHEERQRSHQPGDLLDCLQLTDKAHILMQNPEHKKALGFETANAARRAIRNIESLRNNLAHGQEIVTYDWPQIIRMMRNMGEINSRL